MDNAVRLPPLRTRLSVYCFPTPLPGPCRSSSRSKTFLTQRVSFMRPRPVNVMSVVVANVEESIGHLPQPPPREWSRGALGRVGYHCVGHYFPRVWNNAWTMPAPPAAASRPGGPQVRRREIATLKVERNLCGKGRTVIAKTKLSRHLCNLN